MSALFLLVVLVVILALVFDYSNGFHDAANSIATVVATRVLSPYQAVAWAAFFNFIAAFTFEPHVARTIGKGTVDPAAVDALVILACLVGAVGWNVTTWWLGLPTSSSHALIGGLVGAAVIKAGPEAVVAPGLQKTSLFIIIAPLMGMTIGILLMSGALLLVGRCHPGPVNAWSRRLQLVSSAMYSLGHGLNDAQKTMGIIAVLLVSMRAQVPELQQAPGWVMPSADMERIPWWIILSAHAAIALGTLSGGWRIVRTLGMRITALEPLGGVCAESAGAITIVLASQLGIPVSTTHTISGAVVGVGATRRLSAVRWGVAGRMIWAWVLTIPAAATISAAVYAFTAYVWPALPGPAQTVLALLLIGLLGRAGWAWSRTARLGAAH